MNATLNTDRPVARKTRARYRPTPQLVEDMRLIIEAFGNKRRGNVAGRRGLPCIRSDGKPYASMSEAAIDLGVCPASISRAIESNKFVRDKQGKLRAFVIAEPWPKQK